MTKLYDSQRALVLQGGGSLGAYEAGAYQALYERITKKDIEKGEKDKPFLNIVAGTSIGAINAAIIVSYVVENNTWEGSSERLNEFWEYLSKESPLDQIPGFTVGGIIYTTTYPTVLPLEKLQGDIIRQKSFQLQEYLQFFSLLSH